MPDAIRRLIMELLSCYHNWFLVALLLINCCCHIRGLDTKCMIEFDVACNNVPFSYCDTDTKLCRCLPRFVEVVGNKCLPQLGAFCDKPMTECEGLLNSVCSATYRCVCRDGFDKIDNICVLSTPETLSYLRYEQQKTNEAAAATSAARQQLNQQRQQSIQNQFSKFFETSSTASNKPTGGMNPEDTNVVGVNHAPTYPATDSFLHMEHKSSPSGSEKSHRHTSSSSYNGGGAMDAFGVEKLAAVIEALQLGDGGSADQRPKGKGQMDPSMGPFYDRNPVAAAVAGTTNSGGQQQQQRLMIAMPKQELQNQIQNHNQNQQMNDETPTFGGGGENNQYFPGTSMPSHAEQQLENGQEFGTKSASSSSSSSFFSMSGTENGLGQQKGTSDQLELQRMLGQFQADLGGYSIPTSANIAQDQQQSLNGNGPHNGAPEGSLDHNTGGQYSYGFSSSGQIMSIGQELTPQPQTVSGQNGHERPTEYRNNNFNWNNGPDPILKPSDPYTPANSNPIHSSQQSSFSNEDSPQPNSQWNQQQRQMLANDENRASNNNFAPITGQSGQPSFGGAEENSIVSSLDVQSVRMKMAQAPSSGENSNNKLEFPVESGFASSPTGSQQETDKNGNAASVPQKPVASTSALGKRCQLNFECQSTTAYSVCIQAVCQCQMHYIQVGDRCFPGLGRSCSAQDLPCVVPYATCGSKGLCQCEFGYQEKQGMCLPGLGSECQAYDSPCHGVDNSICDAYGICRCKQGFAQQYGGTCTRNASSPPDSSSCSTGYVSLLGKCYPRLGSRCGESLPCGVVESQCSLDGICVCKHGFVERNGDCVQDQATVIAYGYEQSDYPVAQATNTRPSSFGTPESVTNPRPSLAQQKPEPAMIGQLPRNNQLSSQQGGTTRTSSTKTSFQANSVQKPVTTSYSNNNNMNINNRVNNNKKVNNNNNNGSAVASSKQQQNAPSPPPPYSTGGLAEMFRPPLMVPMKSSSPLPNEATFPGRGGGTGGSIPPVQIMPEPMAAKQYSTQSTIEQSPTSNANVPQSRILENTKCTDLGLPCVGIQNSVCTANGYCICVPGFDKTDFGCRQPQQSDAAAVAAAKQRQFTAGRQSPSPNSGENNRNSIAANLFNSRRQS